MSTEAKAIPPEVSKKIEDESNEHIGFATASDATQFRRGFKTGGRFGYNLAQQAIEKWQNAHARKVEHELRMGSLLVSKDEEIERLKALIEETYIEGQKDQYGIQGVEYDMGAINQSWENFKKYNKL